MLEDILPIFNSIGVSVGLFFIAKAIIHFKLKELHGSSKLLGIITLAIIFGELLYLGLSYGLFDFALEIIASVGVGMVLLGIAFQNAELANPQKNVLTVLGKNVVVGRLYMVKVYEFYRPLHAS
jgi:hypothetical protein